MNTTEKHTEFLKEYNLDVIYQFISRTARVAFRDCAAGYYDKWYRYNHNGNEYDEAWRFANGYIQNERVIFIECN